VRAMARHQHVAMYLFVYAVKGRYYVFLHVVVQLSCYACASNLHAERHVVSTCSHLCGVLHHVASFS
jgi:hypothetical protein